MKPVFNFFLLAGCESVAPVMRSMVDNHVGVKGYGFNVPLLRSKSLSVNQTGLSRLSVEVQLVLSH